MDVREPVQLVQLRVPGSSLGKRDQHRSQVYANGSETPGGKLPGWITDAAWTPSGTVGAFTVRLDSSGTCPAGAIQVWTYSQGTSELLTTYCIGIGDCICRFGLPRPVLSFSPDGQYLVEGRLSGKGSEAIGVYRVADRVRVATLPDNTATAFWDRDTDRLFEVYYTSVRVWTPDGTTLDLPGAASWSFLPNVSPDGGYVAYTAYSNAVQGTNPRVYIYGLDSSNTRMLIDQPRSQVAFVKDGWVWYLEEKPCSDCPNNTQPSGKVYAMNITTGLEQQVVFATGEGLTYATDLLPGEFWPTS